ncbi:MAG TPA: NfeD family protein [Gaiellaceae bacterium]|nr:NfeD family protein [Gaiellaceae bacterium]
MLFVIALLLAIFVLPSPWGAIAVVVALVLDLVEVGVGIWYSKRRKAKVGVSALVGLTGVALDALGPDGQVRVNGEIWRARCEAGCDAGTPVVVRSVSGLTLEVEPA